jgi:alpha-galactosidase
MQISYRHHGNHLVFERSRDEIRLKGLFTDTIQPRPGLEGGSILQVQLTGEDRTLHNGYRNIGSLPGERMVFVSLLKDKRYHGRLIVIILKDPITDVLGEVNYLLCSKSPTIRTWVRIRNDSTVPVELEWAFSLNLHNLAVGGLKPWHDKTYVHLWYDKWGGEGPWRKHTLAELGLLPSSRPGLSLAWQTSEDPQCNRKALPVGMLEDVETRTVWYWQIDHLGSWYWEIGEDDNNQLYFLAGGPNSPRHSWRKELKPGEVVHTVPVAFGCVEGGCQEAMAALARHYRNLVREVSLEPYGQVVS